jgi:ankyrin repeat protein
MEKRKIRINEMLSKARERLFHKPNPEKLKLLAQEQNMLNESLISAVLHGNNEEIMRLIKKGADIAAKDDSGRMSLHIAAWGGNNKTCALLISEYARSGGDVKWLLSIKAKDAWSFLQHAKYYNDNKTGQFLKSMEWLVDATGNAFMKSFADCTA